MDFQTAKSELKPRFLNWLREISQENFPENMQGWWFGLNEPYEIYAMGSMDFDEDNPDWACPEHDDYWVSAPAPDLTHLLDWGWEDVLNLVHEILTELLQENPELALFNIPRVAVGFDDGDVVMVR